ncbi:hypothetical protein ABH931_004187 [Streptacidiphilus sp. MAP12-33]|uniref:hypothetical protein n=1 Tax=Streptacidiphilus sp. MAP12-33 TaxID=3156266 RepID=UPI0035155F96
MTVALVCAFATTLAATLCGCGGSGAAAAAGCAPTHVYTNVKDDGTALAVVDAEMTENNNGSAESWKVDARHDQTLTIEHSTSTTEKVHAAVAGQALVVGASPFVPVAEGEATAVFDYERRTDSSVTRTSTESSNTEITVTVPPGATGYALYGVVMKWTTGDLRTTGCGGKGSDTAGTYLLPEAHAWCTWTRGPDLFTDGDESPCTVVPGSGPQTLN